MKPEQPGVNGIRYAMETNYAYYTVTAKKLFMRKVAVNPYTLEAEGEPGVTVVAGRMGDDFCIDRERERHLPRHPPAKHNSTSSRWSRG